jgi:hypothetical protein
MTGVRDPAFWRRFSLAVHLDEEKAPGSEKASISSSSLQKRYCPPIRPNYPSARLVAPLLSQQNEFNV